MQITKEIELYGGPYDAHHPQPFADKRRSLYIRRGDHMVFAGVVTFGAGREARTP